MSKPFVVTEAGWYEVRGRFSRHSPGGPLEMDWTELLKVDGDGETDRTLVDLRVSADTPTSGA
jgi:hypothetical protein